MSKRKFSVSEKEFQQKRFEASKELLASAIASMERFNAIGEDKQLESIVSNCIFLADQLINELGYVKADPETSSVRTIKSILDSED